jgi:hypothetical protein
MFTQKLLHPFPVVLSVLGTLLALPNVLLGDVPDIQFDHSAFIEFRVIASDSSSKNQVIEIILNPTANLKSGASQDVLNINYRFKPESEKTWVVGDSFWPRISILDFAPRTTLYSSIENPIHIINIEKKSLSGELKASYGTSNLTSKAQAQVGAGFENATESQMRYDQLPPKKVLLSAGTFDLGTGVYFKVNPTEFTTVEGQQKFSMLISTPQNFRIGLMQIECEASLIERGILFDSAIPGHKHTFSAFLVGVDDLEAKEAATQVLKAQNAYNEVLSKGLSEKTFVTMQLMLPFVNKDGLEDSMKKSDQVLEEALKPLFDKVEKAIKVLQQLNNHP